MSLTLAIRIFEALLGWSLMLQTLEYLRVQSMDRVAIWPILRQEIPLRPSWIRACLDKLFKPRPYTALLTMRLALAIALMCGQLGLIGAILLFFTALALLLRWRGAFNGGSDFMTLVGITSALAYWLPSSRRVMRSTCSTFASTPISSGYCTA